MQQAGDDKHADKFEKLTTYNPYQLHGYSTYHNIATVITK